MRTHLLDIFFTSNKGDNGDYTTIICIYEKTIRLLAMYFYVIYTENVYELHA